MSIAAIHSMLLLFNLFFIPRSPTLLEATSSMLKPAFISSRDRPQHPFLDDLTANPFLTTLLICAGAIVIEIWWGGWLRHWLFAYSSRYISDEEKSLAQAALRSATFGVSDSFRISLFLYPSYSGPF
jgi:GPI ethanolamine phosphate transferase 2/3 subunit F